MSAIFNADGTKSEKKGRDVIKTITTNTTLTADDDGAKILIGTDAIAVTLPAIAVAKYGVEYTFFNIGADGNNIMTISPAAADAIHGTITLAASVVVLSGVVNKDLINTKSTATTGDRVTIVSTSAGWLVSESGGIFASE